MVSAVKLRSSLNVFNLEENNTFLNINTNVIVETDQGIDIGRIVKQGCRLRTKEQKDKEPKEIIGDSTTAKFVRIAGEDDFSKLPALEEFEKQAFDLCKAKAAEKNLGMKLIDVKALFGKTKIIFYFFAENRVDFRELVRELAAAFKTRIEMRQIGVREEAKMVGGYGTCGRVQCCSCLGDDFEQVSIKMAKEQNLNFNSMKISGMCGRLMCCLAYEYETYKDLSRDMPKTGAVILSDGASYNVIGADILTQTVTVQDGDGRLAVSLSDIEKKDNAFYIKRDVINRIKQEDENQPEEEDFF